VNPSWNVRTAHGFVLAAALVLCGSCGGGMQGAASTGEDAEVTTRGTLEVTARLVEVPEGAIFKRDLYNYATVLKYEVLEVHRGKLSPSTIYVGHYNPFKPRDEAADKFVQGVGGNLAQFRPGQVHRMAMEESMDECFIGGVVNKYFGQTPDTIYWAVWTNLVER
jgi:hypothetical protein